MGGHNNKENETILIHSEKLYKNMKGNLHKCQDRQRYLQLLHKIILKKITLILKIYIKSKQYILKKVMMTILLVLKLIKVPERQNKTV